VGAGPAFNLHMPEGGPNIPYIRNVADSYEYSIAHGVSVDFSFRGATFKHNDHLNKHFYGKEATADDILSGKVPPPPEMLPLYNVINALVEQDLQAAGVVPVRAPADNAETMSSTKSLPSHINDTAYTLS